MPSTLLVRTSSSARVVPLAGSTLVGRHWACLARVDDARVPGPPAPPTRPGGPSAATSTTTTPSASTRPSTTSPPPTAWPGDTSPSSPSETASWRPHASDAPNVAARPDTQTDPSRRHPYHSTATREVATLPSRGSGLRWASTGMRTRRGSTAPTTNGTTNEQLPPLLDKKFVRL